MCKSSLQKVTRPKFNVYSYLCMLTQTENWSVILHAKGASTERLPEALATLMPNLLSFGQSFCFFLYVLVNVYNFKKKAK